MSRTNLLPPYRGCVRAHFEDGPRSFVLAKGATLQALSVQVAKLRRQHHGKLLDITIKFETVPRTDVSRFRRRRSDNVVSLFR